MSYHYTGGSSSSPRTSGTSGTSSSARQNTTSFQRPPAPPGYHYMPDGSLMADSDMNQQPVSQEQVAYSEETNLDAPPGFHYMPDGRLMPDSDMAQEELVDEGCHGGYKDMLKASLSNSSDDPVGVPVYKICSYNLVTTYNVTTTQNPIPIIYNPSNPWNIVAWTDSNSGTFSPAGFLDFFNQMVVQVGVINIGDRIEVNDNFLQTNTTTSGSGGGVCLSSFSGGAVSGIANKFCLEYLGDYFPPGNGLPPVVIPAPNPNLANVTSYLWDGSFAFLSSTVHVFTKHNCCENFNNHLNDGDPNGWDCEGIANGCVEKFYPQAGQYATQYACTSASDCFVDPTSLDCLDCNNVILHGGGSGGNNFSFRFINPFSSQHVTVSDPTAYAGAGNIAMIGNRFWKTIGQPGPTGPSGGLVTHFREYEIGPNCLITHVRDVPLPAHVLGLGAGMCATTQGSNDPTTEDQVLLGGSVNFDSSWLTQNGYGTFGNHIAKIGIPPLNAPIGTEAYCVPMHNNLGWVVGDLAYVPSSNSHVASELVSGYNLVVHYSSTGNVLGTANIPPSTGMNPFTLFSFEDDVYVNTSVGTYKFDITNNNYSLDPAMDLSPHNGALDGASSPICVPLPPPVLCTQADMDYQADLIVMPVSSVHPNGQWLSSGIVDYQLFKDTMWNNYTQFGQCNWWQNRFDHWVNQLYSGINANGNPMGPYQISLLNAKSSFAEAMMLQCGCGSANISPPSPSSQKSIARRITESIHGEGTTRNNPIKGYTYTAAGNLVSNEKYEEIINSHDKVIASLNFDLTDLTAATETRSLEILGSEGAEFRLEIKNEDNYYYNFHTNLFQAGEASLEEIIGSELYIASVTFPTVTDNDQYDIYLFATNGTLHADYDEIKFGDNTLDLNSSTGSDSFLMQKVLYQYVDLTLTISPFSSTGSISGTITSDTITLQRNRSSALTAFSTKIVCAATAAYRIIKQPVDEDIISFVEPVIGSAPITIEGENIYPIRTAAFTGDDVNGAVTSGSVVRMDNTDLSAVIKVGDKITTAVTTGTVNGAVSSGIKIVMDENVAAVMAVGDQVTGNAYLNANIVTVAALNPDTDNVKEFSLSEAVAISDGVTLSFSSKINRSLTTVTVVETSGTATDFTMSQAIQFRDNAPLAFFNQANYRWPINNFAHIIKQKMIVVPATNLTADSIVYDYQDLLTVFPQTKDEELILKKGLQAVSTLSKTPTVTRGEITTQEGSIIFDKQQALLLAGDTLKIGGYGTQAINDVFGYDVNFYDLKVELTPVTTTTTAAVDNSTSVPVTSRNGILDDVSTVSGIGINPALVDPTVDTGAGAVSGAGTLVLTAAQTLEDGATLTFANASLTATISGKIEVTSAGGANQTLRFDIDKLLSIT